MSKNSSLLVLSPEVTSPNVSKSRVRSDDIIEILQNSPKGRLSYDTGWDTKPRSMWTFMSETQQIIDDNKQATIKRAYRAATVAERREKSFDDNDSSETTSNTSAASLQNTSFRNVSNVSSIFNDSALFEASSPVPRCVDKIPYERESSDQSSSPGSRDSTIGSPRAGVYGIRSDDEDETETDSQMREDVIASTSFDFVKQKLADLERERHNDWIKMCRFKHAEFAAADFEASQASKALSEEIKRQVEARNKEYEEFWDAQNKMIDDEISEMRKNSELRLVKQREIMQKEVEEHTRRRKELQIQAQKEAAAAAAEGLLKLQEEQLGQERQLNLEIQKRAVEAHQKQQDEAAKQAAAASAAAAAAKRKREQVPADFQGLVLRRDFQVYTMSIKLIDDYEAATSFISSNDPAMKNYYMNALKVVNTPLNALAKRSRDEIRAKVQHFTKLLNLEAVNMGETLKTPFKADALPNGGLFIEKMLAFKFVKKAEADVTKAKDTIEPLAIVGVELCCAFPKWTNLLRANFYKMCPFLVPFSFPWEANDTMQTYAMRLGHKLQGNDSAVVQVLLERITGYCTLYAYMVKSVHYLPSVPPELQDFLSIDAVWRIICSIIKLKPQLEVTATVLHTLLDQLGAVFNATFKNQYRKLIIVLYEQYLSEIRKITPNGKSPSLGRLSALVETILKS